MESYMRDRLVVGVERCRQAEEAGSERGLLALGHLRKYARITPKVLSGSWLEFARCDLQQREAI